MPLLMCPNCNSEMREVTRHGVQIDMCPQCRGVWLDRGELEKLMAAVSEEAEILRPEPVAARPAPTYGRPDPRGHYEHDEHYGHHKKHYKRHKRPKSVLEEIFDIFD